MEYGTIQWGLHYRINQRHLIHSRFKGDKKGVVANMAVYKGIDPSDYLIDQYGRPGEFLGDTPKIQSSHLPKTLRLITKKHSS